MAAADRGAWALAGLAGLILGLRLWVGAPMRISTDAMEPNLWRDDVVWLEHGAPDPLRAGQLVAVALPGEAPMVKRLVGLPGQRIEVHPSRGLVVDGQAWAQTGVVEARRPVSSCAAGPVEHVAEAWPDGPLIVRAGGPSAALTVPEGHVYVLGDDRGASGDSRQWGPIPVEQIAGTVRWTLFSRGGCSFFGWPERRLLRLR